MAGMREDILIRMLGYNGSYVYTNQLVHDLDIKNSSNDPKYEDFRQQTKDLVKDKLLDYHTEIINIHNAIKLEYREAEIDRRFGEWKVRITSEGMREAKSLKEEKSKEQITELSEEFTQIISSGTDVMKRINSLLDKTAVIYEGYEIAFAGINNALEVEFLTAMNLFQDYNKSVTNFTSFTGISLELIDVDGIIKEVAGENSDTTLKAYRMKPNLDAVLRNSKKAKAMLDVRIKPIPVADVERLGHLRTQLAQISTDAKSDVYELYIKNIELAITEAESGHDLASALISSRVFSSLLNQMWEQLPTKPSEEDAKKYGRIKFIIDYMKEQGLIEKDREDMEKDIIASDKVSRDYAIHRVSIFIQHGEALRNLGSVVTLLDKMKTKLDK